MPKVKNRKADNYDFAQPMKVAINGKNLPRFELDTKPVLPSSGNPLHDDIKHEYVGKDLPYTVRHSVKTVKAGKGIVRIPNKKHVITLSMQEREEIDGIKIWGEDRKEKISRNLNWQSKFLER